MSEDWYDTAMKEFMFDLAHFNDVLPAHAKKIYSYLVNEGLIDYDVEKEYLWEKYVDE